MRRFSSLTPAVPAAAIVFILLTFFNLTISLEIRQNYILCQELTTSKCFLWSERSIFPKRGELSELIAPFKCYFSYFLPNSEIETNVLINRMDNGVRGQLLCKSLKFMNTGDLPLYFDKTIKLQRYERIRRTTNYSPRGRYRGQTQSQYLAIDRGNNKDEGKAEAHSAADSSRATVSGNSGMGQAQSQTMFDPSCDDCFGRSDIEAASLRKPIIQDGVIGPIGNWLRQPMPGTSLTAGGSLPNNPRGVGAFKPAGGYNQNDVNYVPYGGQGPGGTGGQGSGGYRPGNTGGQMHIAQFDPDLSSGRGSTGGPQPVTGIQRPGGQYGPGAIAGQGPSSTGIQEPGGQYSPRAIGGQGPSSNGIVGPGGQYGPGDIGRQAPSSNGIVGPGGQYGPGARGGQGPSSTGIVGPGGTYGPGARGGQGPSSTGIEGPGGQYGPGAIGRQGPSSTGIVGPGGQYGPGARGGQGPSSTGIQGPGGQFGPDARGGQGPSSTGIQGPGGQFGPGARGGQGPISTGIQGPGGQFGPGAIGGQGPSSNGIVGPGGQYGPGIIGQGPSTTGIQGPGGQYGPGIIGQGPSTTGIQGPGGQFGPGARGGQGPISFGFLGPGGQFGTGAIGRQGPISTGGQSPGGHYGPGGTGTQGPGGENGPGAIGGQRPSSTYSPHGNSGQFGPNVPNGQYSRDGVKGPGTGVSGTQEPNGQFGTGVQNPPGGPGPYNPETSSISGDVSYPVTSGNNLVTPVWSPSAGTFMGPDGLTYVCCITTPNSGAQIPYGQYGFGGSAEGYIPGGQHVTRPVGGFYGPDTSSSQKPDGTYGTGDFVGPGPRTQYTQMARDGKYGDGSISSQGPAIQGQGSSGGQRPGGLLVQGVPNRSGPEGQYSPDSSGGYGPGGSNGGAGSGGQYGPSTSSTQGPGGQYGGQYGTGTSAGRGPSGQFGPGGISSPGLGGQYGPGPSDGQAPVRQPGPKGSISPGPGGQNTPGMSAEQGSNRQYGPGVLNRGQYGPMTTGGQGSLGQYVPGGSSSPGFGGQYGPGTSDGQAPVGQPGPGGSSSTGPGGQNTPGMSAEQGSNRQYGPGVLNGGQYGPLTTGGQGTLGQYVPGGSSSPGFGGQYVPGTSDGHAPGGQPGPGGSSNPGPGGQNTPDMLGGQRTNGHYGPLGSNGPVYAGKYGPETTGVQGPSGQYIPGGPISPDPRGQYTPGTTPTLYETGVTSGPGLTDTQIPGGIYGPGGTNTPGPGKLNTLGNQFGAGQYPSLTEEPGGQYGQEGITSPGTEYGPSYPGMQIPDGTNVPGTRTWVTGSDNNQVPPQNVIDPNTIADGDESEATASVSQAGNGTVASASSKGGNDKGRAQTQVTGTYTGSGSFAAQAEITGENKAANSQVTGDKKGASSTAQGSGRNNKSQANVQLGSETGSVLTGSQSEGTLHSSNSQVQGSIKGGMADAQARGPGSTSSQAQIGFTPYKEGDKSHELQTTPFVGGGMSSAQASGRTGRTQSQLHGTFKYGITYSGGAQAGASADKDAVFPNRLPFDTIDVNDENNKNINVDNQETTIQGKTLNEEVLTTVTEEPTSEVPLDSDNVTDVYNDEKDTASDVSYGTHSHSDHHVQPQYASETSIAPPVESKRSFHTTYNTNNGDYEYPIIEKEDDDYDDDGDEPGGMDHDYNNYKRGITPKRTHLSLQGPKRRGVDVQQTTGGSTQHILLGSLTDHDAEITQRNSERPDESRIYLPGERVPGTGGYTIPKGFTGSVKSVASKDKTYVVGSKESPSQAQTVSLIPGNGKVSFKPPTLPSTWNARAINSKNLRSLNTPSMEDDNRYVSVSKSVTRDLDAENNVRKQYSHTYYTKSSSCGYFTFTCTMVSSQEGKKRVCTPKIPRNPDGSLIRC